VNGEIADLKKRIEALEAQGWEDVQRIIYLEQSVEILSRELQALERENQYLRRRRDAPG
jgi:hypothetical protein